MLLEEINTSIEEHRIKLSLIFFSGILLAPILFIYQDWAGWIVFWMTFALIFFYCRKQADQNLFISLLIIVLAHNIVSILNAYFFDVWGSGGDANGFNLIAQHIAATSDFNLQSNINTLDETVGSRFYEHFLAFFYLINSSKFFGQELSVFAFILSCLVYLKIHQLLELKYRSTTLLFFGLMLASLIWCSLTMREAWELLSIISASYFGLKSLSEDKKKYQNIFIMLCLAAFSSILHVGILFVMLVFLFILLMPDEISWTLRKIFLYLVITIFAGFSLIYILHHVIGVNNIMDFISALHDNAVRAGGNSTYDYSSLNTTSIQGFLFSTFNGYIHYLLGPFPWELNSAGYLLLMLQSLLRLLLLITAMFSIKFLYGKQKTAYKALIIFYLISSFIWSMGVDNYGTAARHQITTDWIIILIGLPFLIDKIKQIKI